MREARAAGASEALITDHTGRIVEGSTSNVFAGQGADELFVCSSIRELLPVVRVDGRPVGRGSPGPTTAQLLRQFRENVNKDMALE